MREIIFRGKRESDGKWFYGNFTNVDNSVCMIHSGKRHYFVERESVGQYTGLRDDVAKEIYEGDIIECYFGGVESRDEEGELIEVTKYNFFVGPVIFNQGGFFCDRVDNIDSIPLWLLEEVGFSIKVIGNTHENENILKSARCCDYCGNNMYDGYYHEDSGDVVCDRECGNKHFEDFEERNEALEIIWTSFEY